MDALQSSIHACHSTRKEYLLTPQRNEITALPCETALSVGPGNVASVHPCQDQACPADTVLAML